MVIAKPSRAMAETARASEFSEDDERFMRVALDEAEGALARWEVPVGCAVVRDGEVVASGSNRTNEKRNVRHPPRVPNPTPNLVRVTAAACSLVRYSPQTSRTLSSIAGHEARGV